MNTKGEIYYLKSSRNGIRQETGNESGILKGSGEKGLIFRPPTLKIPAMAVKKRS